MNDNISNSYNFNAINNQGSLSSIIITPYEKVLSILNKVKQYINSTSKRQSQLIRSLDWVIKVITSHSLYTYELKEKDLINKLTKENNDFKQFVDFVSEYNEQVIEMNKKNIFLGARTVEVANEILQKPSINLKNPLYNSKMQNSPTKSPKKLKNSRNSKQNEKEGFNIYLTNNFTNGKLKKYSMPTLFGDINKSKVERNNNAISNKIINGLKPSYKSFKNLKFTDKSNGSGKLVNTESMVKKKSDGNTEIKTFFIDINKLRTPKGIKKRKVNINSSITNRNEKSLKNKTLLNANSVKDLKKNLTNSALFHSNIIKNMYQKNISNSSLFNKSNSNNDHSFHNKVNTEIFVKSNSRDLTKIRKSVKVNKERLNFPLKSSLSKLSILNLQGMLNETQFDLKLIMKKEFNIFELEKIVGHKNVLPIMGRTMLDSFGLIDEKIMPINKLEPFLISVVNQYLTSTLYHNSLHGADITQTICLFFNNSNAEEVCHTQAIDLLSIIIAGLGHDLGHPGLTNTFQINASSEMAITYNDSSCLENFHLAKLFKTIRKDETNIFEKLTTQEYKIIRKRMISEILATDMAIHGKVLNNIRSKIPEYLLSNEIENNNNKNKKFELITDIKNEETTSEEKQALFDYFIHSADLGHNTKIFNISLKWVELLSKEFWLQGDKERQMHLNISFLCDRDTTNVPKSQVGFIGGFIIPTYNFLVVMFPTLSYTIENAKDNLNKWQKLADAGRKKGWTPEKKKAEEQKNGKNSSKEKISEIFNKKDKNQKEKKLKKKASIVEILIE